MTVPSTEGRSRGDSAALCLNCGLSATDCGRFEVGLAQRDLGWVGRLEPGVKEGLGSSWGSAPLPQQGWSSLGAPCPMAGTGGGEAAGMASGD